MTKIQDKIKCIGVMSGTSLDGLDIISCVFYNKENTWSFKIENVATIKYNKNWTSKLGKAYLLNSLDLIKLDHEFGKYIGTQISKFIKTTKFSPDIIASHGHTVFHQPDQQITLQIGNGAFIAAETKTTTVSNFRVLDVALGGQGAPLVPIGDKILFSEFPFCLNLGGIANISFDIKNSRRAFDICPVNIVINELVSFAGQKYDKDGKIAASGAINIKLLQQLDNIPFYKIKPPKSIGRELIETDFFPLINSSHLNLEDKLRTFYEHIANQLSKTVKHHKKSDILVTGGGAYNKFLIKLISEKTHHNIVIPNSTIVEFKEALIFAFLGLLRIQNKNNCLASVTGANKDNSGGTIFLATS